MADSNKSKRAYNSTRRQEQARQTRFQIADAARKLFIQRGYAGATIEAIAQEAGVASETIYAIFGSKSKILAHLLNISVGGDDAPIGILERPEPQAILQLKDQQQQIRMMAHGITTIMERAAPIFEIMRIAAKTEPDIANMLQHILKERRQNMELAIERVVANGSLRDGLTNAKAADILWTLTSAEVFNLLIVDLGWSKDQYIDWLVDSLIRLLLP
jgi:TetR/AcrR family transcriptional regulator, regulator of autoinduction and epiphytic fitness